MTKERDERGWMKSIACGGMCSETVRSDTMIYYACDKCGFRTSRYLDGRPIPAWDGILRDGSSYEDAAPSEHDWRL